MRAKDIKLKEKGVTKVNLSTILSLTVNVG